MSGERIVKLAAYTLIAGGIGMSGLAGGVEMRRIEEGNFGENPSGFNDAPQGSYDAAMSIALIGGIGATIVGETVRRDLNKK